MTAETLKRNLTALATGIAPTWITQERALEVLNSRGPFMELHYTPEEDVEIRRIWKSLPGWTCRWDVWTLIARGHITAQFEAALEGSET